MADVEAELRAAQLGVLVRELPLRTLVARGKDRGAWLNGLLTCNLAKLAPPAAAYGLIVAKNGKIQSEVYTLLGDEDALIGLDAARAEQTTEVLDRHLVMEDVELELTPAGASKWAGAFGPLAEAACAAARAAGARAGVVRRGALPVAVFTPASPEVVACVLAACGPAVVASDEGWMRARVEHGIPERGVDFDDTNYPQEAALERDAVSFEKGCYLGQEAVFMLEKRGHVKRRLVQLQVDGQGKISRSRTPRDALERARRRRRCGASTSSAAPCRSPRGTRGASRARASRRPLPASSSRCACSAPTRSS
jgi:folate-binding protein YgfZ